MKIAVFDTETIGLEKMFCYNIGMVIYDTETDETAKYEWVIEQIWHNKPLFETAYYADKKPIYINRMRAKKTKMAKFGHVMRAIDKLFKDNEITDVYAYNSLFDERVINFNCDWYRCINPFDTVAFHDIRGYVHSAFAFTDAFREFCEDKGLFTESGNYSTTAETAYRFLYDESFVEEHTALADSIIELQILAYCINEYDLEWNTDYTIYRSVPRTVTRHLTVKTEVEGLEYIFPFQKMTFHKKQNKIVLK